MAPPAFNFNLFMEKERLATNGRNFTKWDLNLRILLSGPGVCVCNSNHNSITWRAESRTHLSKQTRPSTEHSRKASYVRGIPSRPDDQLRWVLIARSQV